VIVGGVFMVRYLNNAARRLWKDESGVVLAVTMIVFLSLFLMALSVYAVGETVRLRIEVQNAADSAAYSGAIIQADCNSRVAALNRAMSWTYVNLCRMEMDYIVDKWLEKTVNDWERDDRLMTLIHAPSTCNLGQGYYPTGKGVTPFSDSNHKKILLNKHRTVTVDDIKDARQTAAGKNKSYHALRQPIIDYKKNIDALNKKEKELIEKLPNRVKTAVETILKGNISDTWNDGFCAGGGSIMYALLQEETPLENNFRILKRSRKEEDDFLRHSDYISKKGDTTAKVLGTGAEEHQWFVRTGGGNDDGLQRDYKQRFNMLISEWDWFSSVWEIVEGECVGSIVTMGSSTVRGEDVRDAQFTSELALPRVLKETFFAKGGSIVVGVSRKVNNPFQFMAVGGQLGIVRPFTLDNGNRFMWTATAAIAGYNPTPREDCQGRYEVTYENNDGDRLWNLKTSDWDAELIPLHRAWAKGAGHAWTGETAGEVLNKVKGGPWLALYGGGGALGAQGAPKGMNEGAEPSYGAAEGWVLH
jgi:hypothetical protein